MEPISKEAEETLFGEIQSGCEGVFTKIFRLFEPSALSHLRRRMAFSDYKHLQADLESDVRLTLWNAVKKFDRTKDTRFSAYLKQCLNNTIKRKIRGHLKERECIEKYWYETSEECVVDVNFDGATEIGVNDRFPCLDESTLLELAPLCKSKELAIFGLIYNDEDVWYKNDNLNNAAIARKLGISREAVRRIITNLRTNRLLWSTICELAPH